MANQPRDGVRNRVIRVPDALWDACKQRAETDGMTMSDVVRSLLADYAGMDADQVDQLRGRADR